MFIYRNNIYNNTLSMPDATIVEKPYICKQCGKCFSLQRRLRWHMHRHKRAHMSSEPRKSYVCAKCDGHFSQRKRLHQHMLKHEKLEHKNKTSYICKTCKRPFARKSTRDRHALTAHGENPFTCATCDESFVHKKHLTQHVVKHTRNTDTAPEVEDAKVAENEANEAAKVAEVDAFFA